MKLMKSEEIKELIQKVERSDKDTFVVLIKSIGYIDMSRKEVVQRLTNELYDASLSEFYEELKNRGESQKVLAYTLGMHPVTFNQFLSGFIKSSKSYGIENPLHFIEKVKEVI